MSTLFIHMRAYIIHMSDPNSIFLYSYIFIFYHFYSWKILIREYEYAFYSILLLIGSSSWVSWLLKSCEYFLIHENKSGTHYYSWAQTELLVHTHHEFIRVTIWWVFCKMTHVSESTHKYSFILISTQIGKL